MSKRSKPSSSSSPLTPRAVLLARALPDLSEAEVQASLAELENLVSGLGIEIVHTMVQKRRSATAAFGEGKLHELSELLPSFQRGPDDEGLLVVVNEELSPGQHRSLEAALEVPVLDRTGVILRIFELRAQTRRARLEVELARLAYEAPRVREDASLSDREGGGGRGARGHSNVELEKQRIRERTAALRLEIDSLQGTEETQRARRKEAMRVALVGYTNAGKSSLMRSLTGSNVQAEDKLFATLGTTVRALEPATAPRVLVSDTVGFIQDLPHELVSSFRSTLEEARDAGLLLFVVDASDPSMRLQLDVTRRAIADVGGSDVPSLVLLNKIDRVDADTRARLAVELPDALQLSAHNPEDVARLHGIIVEHFEEGMEQAVLDIPYSQSEVLRELRANARVLAELCTQDGTTLVVRAPSEVLGRVKSALPEELSKSAARPLETVEQLIDAAEAQGLSLMTDAADLDRSDLDFLVVHAQDDEGVPWVVRTPRRREAFERTLMESQVLALLAPRLPVAIPDWQVHAREVIAYPRLTGTPAVTADAHGAPTWNLIDPAAPPSAFLDSMASLLVALHSVPAEDARKAGIPKKSLGQIRADYRSAMERARSSLKPSAKVHARWERWLADESSWPTHLALVHGDLHPGHLLLDEEARVTGVLDWSEAAFTDPSVDLAMFFGCFGKVAFTKLAARFERAGGKTWPGMAHHAAERWAAFPVLVADWAMRTENEGAMDRAKGLLATVEAES